MKLKEIGIDLQFMRLNSFVETFFKLGRLEWDEA
jgi:hypothetical protein